MIYVERSEVIYLYLCSFRHLKKFSSSLPSHIVVHFLGKFPIPFFSQISEVRSFIFTMHHIMPTSSYTSLFLCFIILRGQCDSDHGFDILEVLCMYPFNDHILIRVIID